MQCLSKKTKSYKAARNDLFYVEMLIVEQMERICEHKAEWRPGQRTCLKCHADYQKSWRETHKPISQEWLVCLMENAKGRVEHSNGCNDNSSADYWTGRVEAYEHILKVIFKGEN